MSVHLGVASCGSCFSSRVMSVSALTFSASVAAGSKNTAARPRSLRRMAPGDIALSVRGIDGVHVNSDYRAHRAFWSQRHLFVAAFLAGVFHPALAHLRRNAIGRTALTAFHVQP